MMIEELIAVKNFRHFSISALLCVCSLSASAGLFDDDEARRAILDMRQRIDAVRVDTEQKMNIFTEDTALLRRSLIDLQNQIESLRSDMATLRGLNEQLSRDVSNLQLKQKDISQGVDERLRQFEPTKVTIDGREFMAAPSEKRDYESALAIFRKGDFPAAEVAFLDFVKRYPDSGYELSALFWLANAQYATRSYKESMLNFRAIISKDPEHLRAPEAVLSIANCQVELKDTRGARKTLTDLIKAYPKSEAAVAAKERLLRLK
jgi:tol-pal system protein YbgF